jgi:pantothenate kinase
VRTEFLNIIQTSFGFEELKTVLKERKNDEMEGFNATYNSAKWQVLENTIIELRIP